MAGTAAVGEVDDCSDSDRGAYVRKRSFRKVDCLACLRCSIGPGGLTCEGKLAPTTDHRLCSSDDFETFVDNRIENLGLGTDVSEDCDSTGGVTP